MWEFGGLCGTWKKGKCGIFNKIIHCCSASFFNYLNFPVRIETTRNCFASTQVFADTRLVLGCELLLSYFEIYGYTASS